MLCLGLNSFYGSTSIDWLSMLTTGETIATAYKLISIQSGEAVVVMPSFVGWYAMFIVCGLLIGFHALAVGVRTFLPLSQQVTNYNALYLYFGDLEEELGSVDDAAVFFLVYAVFILWFFGFTIWGGVTSATLSWIIAAALFIGAVAILVPGFVLKNFGLAFVMYVRGSGRSTSLSFETMLDFVSVSVIMIRFLIQNIRFVFIFAAFFELYEYSTSLVGNFTLNSACGFDVQTSNEYWLHVWSSLLVQWILYIYYLGHLTVLFLAQLSIYFALSFWLFFFLYTTFTANAHESYFNLRRGAFVTT